MSGHKLELTDRFAFPKFQRCQAHNDMEDFALILFVDLSAVECRAS
jgi:hypothetical protein